MTAASPLWTALVYGSETAHRAENVRLCAGTLRYAVAVATWSRNWSMSLVGLRGSPRDHREYASSNSHLIRTPTMSMAAGSHPSNKPLDDEPAWLPSGRGSHPRGQPQASPGRRTYSTVDTRRQCLVRLERQRTTELGTLRPHRHPDTHTLWLDHPDNPLSELLSRADHNKPE